MDINSVLSYFKSVRDVSALYFFWPDEVYPESGMGLGVLADDTISGVEDIDTLEHDCILRSNGPLSVVMLNTAPLYLKHYVASHGRVVFERGGDSHLRFTRQAIEEYSSVVFMSPADSFLFDSLEHIGQLGGGEEYLS